VIRIMETKRKKGQRDQWDMRNKEDRIVPFSATVFTDRYSHHVFRTRRSLSLKCGTRPRTQARAKSTEVNRQLGHSGAMLLISQL